MHRILRRSSGLIFSLAVLLGASAEIRPARAEVPTPAERAMSQKMEALKSSPVQLRMFLRDFPKGADLHNHLSGAIWAEDYLRWAEQDNLCISMIHHGIAASPCPSHRARGEVPAGWLTTHPEAYNEMVDALSMRDFTPVPGDASGHDHFFAAFMRFIQVEIRHNAEMLAAVRNQAAADHVLYLELMITPEMQRLFQASAPLGRKWGLEKPLSRTDLKQAVALLTPGRPALIQKIEKSMDQAEAGADRLLGCRTQTPQPGCGVKVHYLFQTIRNVPPAAVFSQLDAGYQLVRKDPRFVGVNIVAPEDDPVAVRDYACHMRFFAFLNQLYPDVPLSLHAGELTRKLVPPQALKNHIRQAVEVAGARRIGHGIDINEEEDPQNLLEELHSRNVLVEINLTSNDQILNVKGREHPFALYRRNGVPVALSTDDQGLSRGDLTQEYQRAVLEQGVTYSELKALSRASLEYGFLPEEEKRQLLQRLEEAFGVFEARNIRKGQEGKEADSP